MEVLDFAEDQGQKAAAFSLATLEFNRQRAHALLVLLLGGAGAMGGLAISQSAELWLVVAGSVSLWWFVCAAWLAMRALRSYPVRSWAGEGWALVGKAKEFDAYVREMAGEGAVVPDAFTLLREMQLRKMQDAADEYRIASTAAAVALDQTYKAAAFTPVVPVLVVALIWGVSYLG